MERMLAEPTARVNAPSDDIRSPRFARNVTGTPHIPENLGRNTPYLAETDGSLQDWYAR